MHNYNVPHPNPNRSYPYLNFEKVSEKQYYDSLVECGFTNPMPYSEVRIPRRQTKYSAGYDICTPVHITLHPNESTIIPIGIKCKCEVPGIFLEIHIRSSIGIKTNVNIKNGSCIIDADYYDNEKNEGNIMIALVNNSKEIVNIPIGSRIAQGIFKSYFITDNDDTTAVRSGGVGSTGQ